MPIGSDRVLAQPERHTPGIIDGEHPPRSRYFLKRFSPG
jgi:hypothetical protein